MQRVQKLISAAGYCSRRKAEELIAQGKVTINGAVAKLGDKASEADTVLVEGRKIRVQQKLYLALNKPKEILVAKFDPKGRKTIYDLPSVQKVKAGLIHVGRLDYMSEGLLILTTDGDFANLVMHPRYEKKKTYLVRLEPAPSRQDIARIEKGIEVDGKIVRADKVSLRSPNELEITIHEGINRVIRKIALKLGLKVFMLKRISIGSVQLGDIIQGQLRPLTKDEIESFKTN